MAGCGDFEGLFQPRCCCGSLSLDLMIHEHVRYGHICLKNIFFALCVFFVWFFFLVS